MENIKDASKGTVTRVTWKINDTIRHRMTSHPYLVVHISRYSCTVIDLESRADPLESFTILPRNYGDYASDHEMILKKNGEFCYTPLTLC